MAASEPAEKLGDRYAIYGEIASGGMASVHFARLVGPVGFSRTVAVKRLHANLREQPEFVKMFLDEARLATRVRHPNVVATIDVPASHHGTLRPERKNSPTLVPPRRANARPMPRLTAKNATTTA